jgi:hypothetical protein
MASCLGSQRRSGGYVDGHQVQTHGGKKGLQLPRWSWLVIEDARNPLAFRYCKICNEIPIRHTFHIRTAYCTTHTIAVIHRAPFYHVIHVKKVHHVVYDQTGPLDYITNTN